MATETYAHTQRGKLHYLVLATAMLYVVLSLLFDWSGDVQRLLAAIAAGLGVVALACERMTVRDAGGHLEIRYGPLPFVRRRLELAAMTSARIGRTTLIDGWGVQWMPGRGWTYNLWGFDCVEITYRGRTVRVGTDDPRGLMAHLNRRIRQRAMRRCRTGACEALLSA